MSLQRRRFESLSRISVRSLLVLACLGTAAASAQEPAYPSKPIRIVVPAAPGGVTDTLGRALSQQFTKSWGHQAVVENRAGANNIIAAEHVAKSAPDGYTLFLTPEPTFVINPSLYSKLPYDPVKDFAPITGLIVINQALVAHSSVPANSVKELIGLARAKPEGRSYASFGVGSSAHLNMAMFETMAKVRFNHIQYKGAAPALNDVVAGHVDIMFVNVSSALQQWKAGKIKILAMGSARRLARFPEVPTVAESDLPGFEATSWFGLFATGGTPREIVLKLNTEVRRLFSDPGFQEKMLTPNLFESVTNSPEQLAELIRTQTEKWERVIREARVVKLN